MTAAKPACRHPGADILTECCAVCGMTAEECVVDLHEQLAAVEKRELALKRALANALDIIDGNKLAGWPRAVAAMRAAIAATKEEKSE